jgi:hypothetical protein
MANEVGRPTKFDEPTAHKIIELFKAGKTEEEVSQIIGIHVNTLRNWKKNDKEFLWAIREAKEIADDLVEAALFTRAVGYAHKEVKIMSYEGHSFEHEYVKQVEPDVNAATFWLKNRRPDKWRERKEIELEGKVIQVVIDKEDEKL